MSDSDQEQPARCGPDDHATVPQSRYPDRSIEQAVRLFKALGDEARLRLLEMLMTGEACVSELAQASGEQISTVSHRLRLLRSEGLVERRREGRHIYYSLADAHVIELMRNALDHASHHDAD